MIARSTLDSLDGASAVAELYYRRVFRRFRDNRIPARNARSQHEVSVSAATPRLSIDGYASASDSSRSPSTRACRSQRGAPWLDLAAGRQTERRFASHVPNATRTLPRTRLCAGSWILLYVRAAGLSLRLACRSVERRCQQGCYLALRLRGRMGILEFAERPDPASPAATNAPLRSNQRAAVEQRRD
jgi:hypothetical protein